MVKHFIFKTSGYSFKLGDFERGEIRLLNPDDIKIEIERDNQLEPVDRLARDDCRKYLSIRQIYDIPDNMSRANMQELLILCQDAAKAGIGIPEKPTPEKIKELLEPETKETTEPEIVTEKKEGGS